MSPPPARYRVTVHQLHSGASTKVVDIYGSAFITAVATITPDGEDDLLDVHMHDSGPKRPPALHRTGSRRPIPPVKAPTPALRMR